MSDIKEMPSFWSPTVSSLCVSCALELPQPWLFISLHISMPVNNSPLRTWLVFLHKEKCIKQTAHDKVFPTIDDWGRGNIYSPVLCISPKFDHKHVIFPRSILFSERRLYFWILTISSFFRFTTLIGLLMEIVTVTASNPSCLVISHLLFPVRMQNSVSETHFFSRWYYFSSQ